MIDFDTILAKSEPIDNPVTLCQHIEDGLIVLEALKDSFPIAPKIAGIKGFWEFLRKCIIFHDLGKAHREFQKILRGVKENEWYSQRHELFSLPFLEGLELDEQEKQWMRLIVAGHHKSFQILLNDYIQNVYEFDSQIPVFGKQNSFEKEFSLVDQRAVKELLVSKYQISIKPISPTSPAALIRTYLSSPYDLEKTDYFTLLLLFGAFKHCDHLSSACIKHLESLEQADFNFLHNTSYDFYEHQQKASESLGNLILTAPTGSGKTETSLLWLQHQIKHTHQGRVFYILPFTASINAMFERLEDNQFGLGKGKVGMLHGKLSAYLYEYFEDYQYEVSEKKEKIVSVKNKFRTIETPFKILTPFQLLKHLFGLKGFEKGMFEWSGGYFIFDEIHAYEAGLFAQIVILLEYVTKYFGARVLIMTATFPSFMKAILKKSIGECLEVKASSTLYANFKRHRVVVKEGLLIENLEEVKGQLAANHLFSGRKRSVLVVCNTVKSAQSVFKELSKVVENSVLLHSSFCGRDRTILEKKLKTDFPQLLVGTQAIEVSLDIDYDMIYTEPAPLDALIQRFGRVNRKRKKGIASCCVFSERNDSDKYIYSDELIETTMQALENIISQNDGVIDEENLQTSIDFVYPVFNKEQQEDYDNTYQYLSSFIKKLSPFLHSKEREKDFYKQFDGVKVIPAALEKEYRSLLSNFDFIGAETLKVQIRKRQFAQCIEAGTLESTQFVFTHPDNPNSRIIEIDYFLLNKQYDKDLGLLIDVDYVNVDEHNICL